jgi:hypothetical protein
VDLRDALRGLVSSLNLDPTKLWTPIGSASNAYEPNSATRVAIRSAVRNISESDLRELFWALIKQMKTVDPDETEASQATPEDDDPADDSTNLLTPSIAVSEDIMRLYVEEALAEAVAEMYPPPTN